MMIDNHHAKDSSEADNVDDLCIPIWVSVMIICLSTQITERQGTAMSPHQVLPQWIKKQKNVQLTGLAELDQILKVSSSPWLFYF